MFEAPHGAVCAALLPHVMAGNLRALETRAADHASLPRFEDAARLLTGRLGATRSDGVAWLRDLVEELHIPRLGTYALTLAHVPAIVEQAARASSMKGNPLELTAAELGDILAAAI
jgi:alcohol dehydrogenase class IV